MKQYFFVITVFFASICNIRAQTISELKIERLPDEIRVSHESCTSPSHGVIVLRTAIIGLNITMYPPSRIINVNHNRQTNEYILCVEPTDGRYRVIIRHPEFVGFEFIVENVLANKPQIFMLNPKQAGTQPQTAPSQTAASRHPAEPEMIFVQGGTFTMGCTSEQGRDCNRDYERPTHRVTVSNFHIGKYEVTQGQWKALMGTTVEQQRDKNAITIEGSRRVVELSPLSNIGDNYPMYFVSWEEAQEFARRLSAATGKPYRLPTEAEWEYAARGGAQSKGFKYSGSDNLNSVGWFSENSDGVMPVGTKQPNELGIHDMSGNVREWCSDWWGFYTNSAKRDPMGPSRGDRRVIRGGSYSRASPGGWVPVDNSNNANTCRVSNRPNLPYGLFDSGFRLVHP